MYSDNEKVVLCGASAYEQKYYFNQDFASLPQSVQDELHVMCVMFTVDRRYFYHVVRQRRKSAV